MGLVHLVPCSGCDHLLYRHGVEAQRDLIIRETELRTQIFCTHSSYSFLLWYFLRFIEHFHVTRKQDRDCFKEKKPYFEKSDLCHVTSGIIRSPDGEVTLSRLVHE